MNNEEVMQRPFPGHEQVDVYGNRRNAEGQIIGLANPYVGNTRISTGLEGMRSLQEALNDNMSQAIRGDSGSYQSATNLGFLPLMGANPNQNINFNSGNGQVRPPTSITMQINYNDINGVARSLEDLKMYLASIFNTMNSSSSADNYLQSSIAAMQQEMEMLKTKLAETQAKYDEVLYRLETEQLALQD